MNNILKIIGFIFVIGFMTSSFAGTFSMARRINFGPFYAISASGPYHLNIFSGAKSNYLIMTGNSALFAEPVIKLKDGVFNSTEAGVAQGTCVTSFIDLDLTAYLASKNLVIIQPRTALNTTDWATGLANIYYTGPNSVTECNITFDTRVQKEQPAIVGNIVRIDYRVFTVIGPVDIAFNADVEFELCLIVQDITA